MADDESIKTRFGKRVLEFRKSRSWNQDELGKKPGTSVVGRYECGEMIPFIEVAHRMAEDFGVAVDYFVGEQEVPRLPSQSDMIERWTTIDWLPREDRDRILYVADSLSREATARHAFTSP